VKTLSVKLPEPLAKWLIDEANSTRRSRSDLVREALELRRQGNGRTPKKRITMVDAMADLRGSVSGPTDLSTNPKYFADFCK
jgi:Arc/MetJ-type ribon-helix-helix transcriptional regulator